MHGGGRKPQVASPLVVGVLAFPALVPFSFHLINPHDEVEAALASARA